MNPPLVEPLQAWQTAWPALPAVLMLLGGLWRLRRELVPGRWLGAVLVLAVAVRTLVMPIWLHQYDGHEAEYLDLWMGTRELTQGGTMLYPAMQWLYRGLGFVAPVEHGPMLLSVAASLFSIAALHGLLSRLVGPRVALAGAAALALCGTHAFWSSSAYNVVLPHAFAMTALWGVAVLARRGDPLGAGLVAGGAAVLAVATRIESFALAPVGVAILLAWRPPEYKRWLPPLGVSALLGAVAAALVVLPGGQVTPGSGQRALAFATNATLLDFFAPFDALWMLPVVLVAAVLALRIRPGLFAPLLALAVGSHLVFSSFDDYGFRHLLNALAAVCAALGVLVRHKTTLALYIVALGGLAWQTLDVRERYYASEQVYAETLDAALPVRTSVGSVEAGGERCALINEDSRIVPEPEQLSHFNLLDPEEAQRLRSEHGCIVWLKTVQDHRWSSRSVRARAIRLEHLYRTTPIAVVKRDDGFVGELVEVGERK